MCLEDVDIFMEIIPFSYYRKEDLIDIVNSKRPAITARDTSNNMIVGFCMIKLKDLGLGGLTVRETYRG